MLRRALGASFAGGVYVFPGGRVDAADHADELEAICDDLDDEQASARLGLERGGLAFWVAAIRECFEEAGVLLARPVDGDDGDPLRRPGDRAAFRRRPSRTCTAVSVRSSISAPAKGLRLLTGLVQYVAHWITPIGEPKRFDTRFFLALAPPAQEPLHDDSETIASLWVTPRDALGARCRRRTAAVPAHDPQPRVPRPARVGRGGTRRRRRDRLATGDPAPPAVRRRRSVRSGWCCPTTPTTGRSRSRPP